MNTYRPLPLGILLRYKIPDLQEQEFGVKVVREEILPTDQRASDLFTNKLREELAVFAHALPEKKAEAICDLLTITQDIIFHKVKVNRILLQSAFHLIGACDPTSTEMALLIENKRALKGDYSKLIIVITESSPPQNS